MIDGNTQEAGPALAKIAGARRRLLPAAALIAAPFLSGLAGLSAQDDQEGNGFPDARRAATVLGEALRSQSSLPGLAVSIGIGGRVVYSSGFGYASLETRTPASGHTRWRVGSISKSFTAAGAVLLAERGHLDLDAPIARVFPPWAGHPAGTATVRELGGHLAGIRHYRDGEGIGTTRYSDVTDALGLFSNDSLVARPGEEYSYSTYGYTLLSAIMQRAADRPFLAWMDEEVFAPLGMARTVPDRADRVIRDRASFYDIRDGAFAPAPFTDNSYKWAGGGFLSTTDDMVRFGGGLLTGRLLAPDRARALFQTQTTRSGEDTGYGLGFRPRTDREGRVIAHHGGSSEGGRAFLLLYPQEEVVVAMAANRATAPLFSEEAETLAHFFIDHVTDPDATLDEELTGRWSMTGRLGRDTVGGSLRLYSGRLRGLLEWSDDEGPIPVALVDRHGSRIRLIGAGPHGLMNAWLEPRDDGWGGTWEYLGRTGELELHADPASSNEGGDGALARTASGPSSATCRSDSAPLSTDPLERARRVLSELKPKVRFTNTPLPDMGLAARMARYEVPGVAIAVVSPHGDGWVCVAGVRDANEADPVGFETMFHAKSISKAVAAVAALRLVATGDLALDEPVANRVRRYTVPDNRHTRQSPPTLRHLLSHSAGFTRAGVDSYRPDEPLPTLLQSLEGESPARSEPLDVDFVPGTRFRYSGGGYGVLQVLIEDVTSEAFPEVVDRLVFTPLGMERSIFPQPLPELVEPFAASGHDSHGDPLPGGHETLPIMAAGGLWTTAPNLARFVAGVNHAWTRRAGAILPPELAEDMLSAQTGGWGLGFELPADSDILLYSHGGSGDGFRTLLAGLPEIGAGVVVLANGNGAGPLREEIVRSVAEEYDWPVLRERSIYALATSGPHPAVVEGAYEWPSGVETEIETRNGHVLARFNKGAWKRLFPLESGEFVSLEDERYTFRNLGSGAAELLYTDDTGTYRGVLTRSAPTPTSR